MNKTEAGEDLVIDSEANDGDTYVVIHLEELRLVGGDDDGSGGRMLWLSRGGCRGPAPQEFCYRQEQGLAFVNAMSAQKLNPVVYPWRRSYGRCL